MSLLHIQRKPSTYLASRLTISPNRLKQASICQRHLGVPLVEAKKISMPWYICHKPYNNLAWRLTLTPNRPKRASTRPTSPRCSIGCAQNNYQAYYCTFRTKPWNYLVWRLTQSPNGPKRASIWPTSPRRSIECSQKDFYAHGIFGTIRALIWHQD
jgi:hypothetical protein